MQSWGLTGEGRGVYRQGTVGANDASPRLEFLRQPATYRSSLLQAWLCEPDISLEPRPHGLLSTPAPQHGQEGTSCNSPEQASPGQPARSWGGSPRCGVTGSRGGLGGFGAVGRACESEQPLAGEQMPLHRVLAESRHLGREHCWVRRPVAAQAARLPACPPALSTSTPACSEESRQEEAAAGTKAPQLPLNG